LEEDESILVIFTHGMMVKIENNENTAKNCEMKKYNFMLIRVIAAY